ncbi:MAG: hypothetical protein K2J40_05545 [Ruminococcus sp.]|nr:hypothetical protein [Ruminococcus sp.]
MLRRNHDDSYALLTASSCNKGCLDVYNISPDDGANICQWEYWGGEGQKFIIEPIAEPQKIAGDVNSDGKFDIADIVLFQKWLLAVPDTALADWKAADFCEDNRLDVFDLCLMKQKFLHN